MLKKALYLITNIDFTKSQLETATLDIVLSCRFSNTFTLHVVIFSNYIFFIFFVKIGIELLRGDTCSIRITQME